MKARANADLPPRPMWKVRQLIDRVAFAVLLVGGSGMLISMFLGTADVIGTQLFGAPVPGTLELTESTMVLIVFGGLCYAQINDRHIRVELIYTHMGPRGRAAMDVFATVVALVFFGLLLWQAVNELIFSWRFGEATIGLVRFPLWPTRLVLATGTTLLLTQLLIDLILALLKLRGCEEGTDGREKSVLPGAATDVTK